MSDLSDMIMLTQEDQEYIKTSLAKGRARATKAAQPDFSAVARDGRLDLLEV